MESLKLLRVATRILMDVVVALERDLSGAAPDFEIGCRCKSIEVAMPLQRMLAGALADIDVRVAIKDDTIVIVTPRPSYPGASSPLHLNSPTPLPPSPPSLSPEESLLLP